MADTPPSKASEEMSPRQPGRKLERRNYAPSLDENRIDAAVVELFEKYSGISRAKIAEHSESIVRSSSRQNLSSNAIDASTA